MGTSSASSTQAAPVPSSHTPLGNVTEHQTQPRPIPCRALTRWEGRSGTWRYLSTFLKGSLPGSAHSFSQLSAVCVARPSLTLCPPHLTALKRLCQLLCCAFRDPLPDFRACLLGEKPAFCLPLKRRFINMFFLFKFICVSFTLHRQFCFSSTVYFFLLAGKYGRFPFIINILVS